MKEIKCLKCGSYEGCYEIHAVSICKECSHKIAPIISDEFFKGLQFGFWPMILIKGFKI